MKNRQQDLQTRVRTRNRKNCTRRILQDETDLIQPKAVSGKHHNRRFYVFLFVYLSIGTYVFANVLNLQFWPFSYFNPPETVETLYRNLDYPPIFLFEPESRPLIVHVELTLKPGAPLAEMVPTYLSAVGSVNSSYAMNISQVFVGFVGSRPTGNVRMANFQFPFVILSQTGKFFDFAWLVIGPVIGGTPISIVWDKQGDFEPFMVISFTNSTTASLTFPYLTVHVNSLDVARSERYNRVNAAVSIALVFFAFVEGYGMLRDIDKRTTQSNDSANQPTPTKSPPNKPKPTRNPSTTEPT
jgi:hypothetical protein